MRASKHAVIVALGGGGDVLSAAMFAESLRQEGFSPVLVSLAWERFVKDPLPGPRRPSELLNIDGLSNNIARATTKTTFPSGASINQALIGDYFDLCDNILLDPYQGVCGLVEGFSQVALSYPTAQVWGIDVGGDVLADRSYPGLRSPLADSMLLSALISVFPDARVAVLGLGVDGELPARICERLVSQHLNMGKILDVVTLPREAVLRMAALLDARLVDTEATAMVVRSYQGFFGRYLTRDAGSIVKVSSSTLLGFVYRASEIGSTINPLPSKIRFTTSLDEASRLIEQLGFHSEWRYEVEKAARAGQAYPEVEPSVALCKVESLLMEIKKLRPVVDFVAERYLAERLKIGIQSIRSVFSSSDNRDKGFLLPPFLHLSSHSKLLRFGAKLQKCRN